MGIIGVLDCKGNYTMFGFYRVFSKGSTGIFWVL